MAVVVSLSEQGARIYRSMNGMETTESEKERANLLDDKLIEGLKTLKTKLDKDGILAKKEKVVAYWELGNLLIKLSHKADLDRTEAPYFFENAKLRLPEQLNAVDRGPNRQHIKYCYRLGKYSESTAKTLKWSEWSYLFDSSSINSEERFDSWFNEAIKNNAKFFDRKSVRLLGKLLNNFFHNIETADLTDTEILNCYEVALKLCNYLREESSTSITEKLKLLKKQRVLMIEVMNGKLDASELLALLKQE